MLLVRDVFTARPGQASKLAAIFKKSMGSKVRIMTDVVGKFNTVVMERTVENLQQFEKEMEEYRAGKGINNNEMSADDKKAYFEMYMKGRREIFRIQD